MSIQYLKRKCSRALLAMVVVSAGAAHAADSGAPGTTFNLSGGGVTSSTTVTPAGTDVVNEVSLDYDVAGVDQTDVTAQDTFKVDRLLDISVVAVNDETTGPPSGTATMSFDVTNQSNDDALDLPFRVERISVDVVGLGSSQLSGNTIAQVCIDTGPDGTCDSTLTASGGIYTIPAAQASPGSPVRILVDVNIPGAASDGNWDSYVLAAGLAEAGGSRITFDDNNQAVPGGSSNGDSGDTVAEEDVFGDTAVDTVSGTSDDAVKLSDGSIIAGGDQDFDGQDSARDQILVEAATLDLTKSSVVIWDPIQGLRCNLTSANDGTDDYAVCNPADNVSSPNALPGAIVKYTISVINNGSGSAQEVDITDNIPDTVVPGNDDSLSGLDGAACNNTATGLAGSGGTCASGITPGGGTIDAGLLGKLVVTDCAGTVDAVDLTDPFTHSVATGAVECDNTDTGSIVYYVTIP